MSLSMSKHIRPSCVLKETTDLVMMDVLRKKLSGILNGTEGKHTKDNKAQELKRQRESHLGM